MATESDILKSVVPDTISPSFDSDREASCSACFKWPTGGETSLWDQTQRTDFILNYYFFTSKLWQRNCLCLCCSAQHAICFSLGGICVLAQKASEVAIQTEMVRSFFGEAHAWCSSQLTGLSVLCMGSGCLLEALLCSAVRQCTPGGRWLKHSAWLNLTERQAEALWGTTECFFTINVNATGSAGFFISNQEKTVFIFEPGL